MFSAGRRLWRLARDQDEVPQELRDQIQEFIYGGQRGTVAPECKPQDPLGPDTVTEPVQVLDGQLVGRA